MAEPESATHHLERLAGAAFDETRAQAAQALSHFPDQARELLPPLVKALGDQGAVVVAESARTLGTFGARAAPAIPHLEQQLAHPDPVVRATVQQALEKIRGP